MSLVQPPKQFGSQHSPVGEQVSQCEGQTDNKAILLKITKYSIEGRHKNALFNWIFSKNIDSLKLLEVVVVNKINKTVFKVRTKFLSLISYIVFGKFVNSNKAFHYCLQLSFHQMFARFQLDIQYHMPGIRDELYSPNLWHQN